MLELSSLHPKLKPAELTDGRPPACRPLALAAYGTSGSSGQSTLQFHLYPSGLTISGQLSRTQLHLEASLKPFELPLCIKCTNKLALACTDVLSVDLLQQNNVNKSAPVCYKHSPVIDEYPYTQEPIPANRNQK